jgi:HD superfamily phosphohydrolase
MYDDVYYHKTTRCVECLLSKIFTRVNDLAKDGRLAIPYELEFIERRIKGRSPNKRMISPDDLLLLDDHSIYSLLLRWSKDNNDSVLTDLSKRIIQRKLLKSISYESEETDSSYSEKKD